MNAWRSRSTNVGISFPVNDPLSMHALAVGKTRDRFVVDAISTDGGGILRNVQLERGMAKGHLAPGADVDLTVVDPDGGRPHMAVARAQVIMVGGVVVGRGGTALMMAGGIKHTLDLGLEYALVDLEKRWLCRRPVACATQV